MTMTTRAMTMTTTTTTIEMVTILQLARVGTGGHMVAGTGNKIWFLLFLFHKFWFAKSLKTGFDLYLHPVSTCLVKCSKCAITSDQVQMSTLGGIDINIQSPTSLVNHFHPKSHFNLIDLKSFSASVLSGCFRKLWRACKFGSSGLVIVLEFGSVLVHLQFGKRKPPKSASARVTQLLYLFMSTVKSGHQQKHELWFVC